ncbi:MAG: AraC family transcriptional regulator [Lentisphaeria bacterium]
MPDLVEQPDYYSEEAFQQWRPESPVLVQRVKLRCAVKRHGHCFSELAIMAGGSGRHEGGGPSYELATGDFLVVSGRQTHAYLSTGGLQVVNVLVRAAAMDRLATGLAGLPGFPQLFNGRLAGAAGSGAPLFRPHPLDEKSLADCLAWVDRMEREGFDAPPGFDVIQGSCLTALLAILCRQAANPAPRPRSIRAQVADTLQYMDRHYATEVTHEELAAAAGMSGRSFQRHFKAVTGMTPMQNLLAVRIAKAEILLRETEAPVHAVANACGFRDSNYFATCFRRITGRTPGRFRAKV